MLSPIFAPYTETMPMGTTLVISITLRRMGAKFLPGELRILVAQVAPDPYYPEPLLLDATPDVVAVGHAFTPSSKTSETAHSL
jgi:hypothetical protein